MPLRAVRAEAINLCFHYILLIGLMSVPMSRANMSLSFASHEYWTDFDEICGR